MLPLDKNWLKLSENKLKHEENYYCLHYIKKFM